MPSPLGVGRSGPVCDGCGVCCRKGGPLLHGEDAPLVTRGYVPLARLVTLRRGELVHDPVAGRVLPLEEEAIKVQGTGEPEQPWHCVFHREAGQGGHGGCGVYAQRPAQCRALFCKNTSALEALYAVRRLDRAALLLHVQKAGAPLAALDGEAGMPPDGEAGIAQSVASGPCGGERWPEALLALAQVHEEQCPLPPLAALAPSIPDDAAACTAMLEAVRLDLAFRELAVERGGVPPILLPFVLGRPLRSFLLSLGLDIRQSRDGTGQNLTLLRTRGIAQ